MIDNTLPKSLFFPFTAVYAEHGLCIYTYIGDGPRHVFVAQPGSLEFTVNMDIFHKSMSEFPITEEMINKYRHKLANPYGEFIFEEVPCDELNIHEKAMMTLTTRVTSTLMERINTVLKNGKYKNRSEFIKLAIEEKLAKELNA